ncbi:MAG TPA: hypothetical protein ENF69_00460 [Euryarchaeota archaeon]|nr:MAG: hypothetical protein DRN55_01200 [Thermoplasmata archaeon]HDD59406.1 hypothetical protein [Euryarchaeota archaeon]
MQDDASLRISIREKHSFLDGWIVHLHPATMFLRSKVIKIPPKRETKNIYIPEDNTSLTSMRRGEQLNWIKNIVSTMNIAIPTHKTILLTHAPIVGHGGKGTHYNRLSPDKDIDELFVKWVNGEFKFQKDPRVEAVFCGHTHENHIFYHITTENMNDERLDQYNCYYHRQNNRYKPEDEISLTFLEGTFCIETTTATLGYP